MLNQLGFGEGSVHLIMECVCSAKYQICHARKRFGWITSTRGIRQCDPLSSYLFLICREGLFVLIQEYERRNYSKGIKVARGAPRLTYMFFADDTYIYYKAKEDEADHVLNFLNIFERASWKKINADKSSIFFTCNTDSGVRNMIWNMMQFKEADNWTKYLGLPNILGRNKNTVLGYLKDSLQERFQGWEKKSLSKDGKELLLKMVVQALPSYAMSTFLLPQ